VKNLTSRIEPAGTGMVVQCECDAEKMQKWEKVCYSSAMRCNTDFDSIFALHSHFALLHTFWHFSYFSPLLLILRIFLALFTTFWCIIKSEILTKKVEKVRDSVKSVKSVT
jgi:hypothetical protein